MISFWADYFNLFGAGLTVILGCLGLFFPKHVAAMTGLHPVERESLSEFRATFGGIMIVLGVVPIFTGISICFVFTGLVWLGSAFGRLLSLVLDKMSAKVFLSCILESLIAALLLVGHPYSLLKALIF